MTTRTVTRASAAPAATVTRAAAAPAPTVVNVIQATQVPAVQDCLGCHGAMCQTFVNSRHAQVGVFCDGCHGSSVEYHAANPDDPLAVPVVDYSGAVCGQCHVFTSQHPQIYAQWKTSAHNGVVEDMNPASRFNSCGRCHSGSARVSILDGFPLPAGQANVGIGCPTCHDPHASHIWRSPLSGVLYTNQLRNPVDSTNDYSLASTDPFPSKYNAQINVCGQCHNESGASWTNSASPPHYSPQYNMLLGTAGVLATGLPPRQPATHAFIPQQCVACHMQPVQLLAGQPEVAGHGFEVTTYQLCAQCHGANAQGLVAFTKLGVSAQIQEVQFALDFWATNQAPLALRSKYGTRSWEYTTPGSLSPGGAGPTAKEQALIPVNIRKARFNLYLVLNDGSFGAHNAPFTAALLDTAEDWIADELGL